MGEDRGCPRLGKPMGLQQQEGSGLDNQKDQNQ